MLRGHGASEEVSRQLYFEPPIQVDTNALGALSTHRATRTLTYQQQYYHTAVDLELESSNPEAINSKINNKIMEQHHHVCCTDHG